MLVDSSGSNHFPKCEDMKKLGQHLADWEEMIGKYGQNLMGCPGGLRTMTLGVIPKSYEDEFMHEEVGYPNWRSVISYCTRFTRPLQHRAYADLLPPKISDRKGLRACVRWNAKAIRRGCPDSTAH